MGTVVVRGWLRTARHSKNVSFLEVTDGSGFAGLQAVAAPELPEYEETVRKLATGCAVEVEGDAKGILSPKDLILHLIGDPYFREEQWRESPTDTCIVEFGGPGLTQWNVDELSVLTNMTVEGGLMTGVVEPCEPIVAFLKERRGVDATDLLVHADPGATYVRTIEVNLDEVPLTVATPGDSRNRAPLSDHHDVAIHNIVIASCTGGSLADLRAAADVLRGNTLSDGTRLSDSTIDGSIIGINTVIRNATVRRSLIMGVDPIYPDAHIGEEEPEVLDPSPVIQEGTVIEGAIIDKNARIGRNVTIKNADRVQNADGDGWAIRDGIVVVCKGAEIPDGTVI